MMQGCDTLLMVGSSFPYTRVAARAGPGARRADRPRRPQLGIRYPMEVNLVGDARDTLRALIPLLERKADRSWQEELEGEVDRWWRILADRAGEQAADPLNPLKVFHELSPRLPDGCDHHRRLRLGHQLVGAPPALPPRHARRALRARWPRWAPRCPYALAAKFVLPRPAGDRGRGRRRDADERHQRADRRGQAPPTAGATRASSCSCSTTATSTRSRGSSACWPATPSSRPRQVDSRTSPTRATPSCSGFKGIRVDSPEAVGPAWDEALAADVPVVLRGGDRPRGPAAAAAHRVRAGEEPGQGARGPRSGAGRSSARRSRASSPSS